MTADPVDDLAGVLAGLARRLPAEHVRAWAAVLASSPGPDAGLAARLIDVAGGYAVGSLASGLVRAWRAAVPQPAGGALALALRAAARVHAADSRRRTDLVVSGPTSDAVPVRLTSSVVVEIIREAVSALLVVSFAAYGVREVVRELGAAADRGVAVDLVLESTVVAGGALRGAVGAGAAFESLRGRVRLWNWPSRHRRTDPHAALHAKFVLADRAAVLLGSANLTDRALAHNLEVGVVLRDPEVAGALAGHFAALMRPGHGPLEPVDWP